MDVKVISRDTVKPSSPTPPHLRTFKIALTDKLNLPVYFTYISFYRIKKDDAIVDHYHLKHSLSQTLTRFYPLAGRLGDDDTVDCNDKGAMFCTARVNCTMTELLANPKSELFYRFAPPLPPVCAHEDDGPAQIAIQLNEFSCGGVALCVCFSHKIIDMITIMGFVKCWAAIANGSPTSVTKAMYPDLQSGESLFPQGNEESLPTELYFPAERKLVREGKGIVKRFVFEGGAVSTLKAQATSQRVPNPSRVEALSAFIWKRCMVASTTVWGSQQPSMVCHAVDLRRRMVPPLSEFSLGNIILKTLARCDATTAAEVGLDSLVVILRDELEKIKANLVPKLQNGGGFRAIREHLEEEREICRDKSINSYIFSSWRKMGHNEVDFGWGKPIWVSQMGGNEVDSIYKNIVILMDGETGTDKIEAWLVLDQREMAVLESDSEFLELASPNPPILV